jgi:hypothetical protein
MLFSRLSCVTQLIDIVVKSFFFWVKAPLRLLRQDGEVAAS